MQRPKYLEYRHRRGNIQRFSIKRTREVTREKPAVAILRLVGKKTAAVSESFDEEWTLELRTTDVKPDYSGLIKTQVTEAARIVKGEKVAYDTSEDPTTEFLNETVDRYGKITDHHGSLPTPHLLVFPEDPQLPGAEWTVSRHEIVAITGPDGQIKNHDPRLVTYQCRFDDLGEENGIEFVDISFHGQGVITDGEDFSQRYETQGSARFALRDGYILSAQVSRSNITTVDKIVLTRAVKETISYDSSGTEQTVGGMRI